MWIGALAVAAAGIAPATAGAQTGSFFAIGVGQPITQQTIPLRMTGRIIVQFHGDAAAGCAVRGLCGYTGTVSWAAPHSSELDIESSRIAGRTQYTFAVFPQPAGPGAPSSGITSAEVTRTPFPGQTVGTACTDVTSTLDPFMLIARNGRVRFNLAQASPALLATRCAGPRDDAIIPRLPAPRLSVARLRRGRLTVGLGGSRSFSVDGFAGTVVSDLMVRLGRPGRTTRVRTSTPTGRPRRALRLRLRATVAGSLVEHVTADADPGVCLPLGACGLTGTLTIRPAPTAIPAQIEAVAPAGQPPPSLKATAGGGTGRARRISVFGTAFWPGGGTLVARIEQDLTQCTDSTRWEGGLLTLGVARGRLIAAYSGTGFLTGVPSLTGCPGPGGVSLTTPLAAGAVSLSRLARRRITIRLTTPNHFQDYGYGIRTTSDLTLTLTRVGGRVITVPSL